MECAIFQNVKNSKIKTAQLRRVVFSVLEQAGQEADISLHLISDARMKKLNHQYCGKNQTTDVLSFAATTGIGPHDQSDLGDIFVSIPQVCRQAKNLGITYLEEFYRMLIHGILHLLGYDHVKRKDAEVMFELQEQYLKHIKK